MADTNLAVNTTLANIVSQMKVKLGIESQQLSQVNPNRLIEIIHDAIQAVRDKNIQVLEWFYRYKATVVIQAVITPVMGTVNISTANAADLKTLIIASASRPTYRILPNSEFELYQTLYTSTELDTMYIATVRAVSGVLSVEFWGRPSDTNILVSYLRNPRKTTVPANKVDIPDNYIPFVVEAAVKLVKEEPIYASAK